ncbi:phosphatidylinositol phosphate synthase [Georgenia yuyongxinii]|uniref:phosphatidylinositol phosphate synthase n=1 Tax=Georgenia yuyongxinii TaxID=2589797 RepID=UPI002ED8E704
MLSRNGRGFAAVVFGPAARVLVRLGVSPDVVTVSGTAAVTAAALTLLPADHLAVGALVLGALVVADNLDGQMARMSNRVSRWGAFLDSTMDRIADAAIFCGVLLWALRHLDGALGAWTAGLALACLVLGGVVPYAKARAEGLGMTADVGLAERADRLLVVLVATLLVGLGLPAAVLTAALGLLAVASAVTVVQRMRTVYVQARDDGAAPGLDGVGGALDGFDPAGGGADPAGDSRAPGRREPDGAGSTNGAAGGAAS